MKRLLLTAVAAIATLTAPAQAQGPTYKETEVYNGPDIVFRQIDEHTWEGNGKVMSSETLYIVEGEERAVLIDAGTRIAELDKIVAGITSKPVTLIITHVHPDHTGSAINLFDEIWINAADMVNVASNMRDYRGEIKYLTDGETIDLGGRELEVIFTPGHTPGSTTFVDKASGYGFSGDAFGSGNLLLFTNFSTLWLTCQRMSEYMALHGITKLYPGHYMGTNVETQRRVADLLQMARDVLDGKLAGEHSENGRPGLQTILNMHGVRINYGAGQLK